MTADSGAGRPTKYLREYADQAEKLARLGLTDFEIAQYFGVCERTIYNWKNEHPEFLQAVNVPKKVADDRVVRSLYHRAVGYSHNAVKIFQHQGTPVEVPYVEHVPPDTTAAIFWLKNRDPENWREKVAHEHTGPDGGPIRHRHELTDAELEAIVAAGGSAGAADPPPGAG